MSEPRLSKSGRYARFDGMVWPTAWEPDEDHCDLEWTLRYGKPTRSDISEAASIISAYKALIYGKTQKQRNAIVSNLRKAIDTKRSQPDDRTD